MIQTTGTLVGLLQLLDQLPLPTPTGARPRGRPSVYSERLFLKALVVMIVRRLPNVHLLYAVLQQPTAEMAQLRAAMSEHGRFPSRRTFERRLADLPDALPEHIGRLGRLLVAMLAPWQTYGRAVAADSTVLRANGGVWHLKQRVQQGLPHLSIDVEADWTKSGWHGWVYGWKRHVITTVAPVWIPVAATLTRANTYDGTAALELLPELPDTARVVLGDRHFSTDALRQECAAADRLLVTPQAGPYPHPDPGVEVRRVFHRLRSTSCEPFHQLLKGLFELHGQVPTKGLRSTQRFVLGAVLVYQLAFWYRFTHGLPLQTGIKAFLKAA